MIIIAGTLDLADPAGRDALVAAAVEYQRATREEEPGCEAYCFAADPVVPGRIQVYELWTDEASLAAHFVHPNYLNMRALLGGAGLAKAVTAKYRCDLSEPVYDATRTPRADFFTAT
jgi:quinol monooxygenase YgiN